MLKKFLFIATLLTFPISLIGWEIWVRRTIRRLRSDFQWLITEQDEAPDLDPHGLSKFIANGYDPELGWVRKPNTQGTDRGRGANAQWSIDALGARKDPYMEGAPIRVVVVGDSYAFSRQVGDSEAWPAVLGRLLTIRVINFGVGNYGVDQAVLRYRRDGHIPGLRVGILGVVPETMTRIHSAWKHYSEYGNTFAFKPRFHLSGGQLELLPNVIDSPEGFARYRDYLPMIRQRDYFYKTKFRRDMIRTPYLWHWLVKRRNRRLVALLLQRERHRVTNSYDEACEAAPFRSVLQRNIRIAAKMYEKPECLALFKALVLLFAAEVRAAGAEPVFAMFPQLLDLECFGNDQPYRPLLNQLAPSLHVVDALEALGDAHIRTLYAEDTYGGHYSAQGNDIIARLMARHIAPLLQK